jgi:hypothetical protein
MAASVGMRLIRRMQERRREAGSAMSLAWGSKALSAPATPTYVTTSTAEITLICVHAVVALSCHGDAGPCMSAIC